MVEDLMSTYGSRMVIAIVGVGLALLCLVGILWLLRGRRPPSPFVRGGRNRQPRLQVLDAAAVDARRRLVLVRRDDVEHLIMIGGPTDVVIESRIAASSPSIPAETAASSSEPKAAPPAQRPAQDKAFEPARPLSPRPEPARREPPAPSPSPRTEAPPRPVASASAIRQERPTEPIAGKRPAQGIAGQAGAPQPISQQGMMAQPVLSPAAEYAANALDAARSRPIADPQPATRAPAVETAAAPAPAGKTDTLGSDFNRILEEEMAQKLASSEAPAVSISTTQLPARDPAVPPITGATADPSLQDEVARIFGEMSARREK